MAQIDVVIVEPSGVAYETQIENDFRAFQKVVGGYIQGVFGEECVVYVNEEGLLQSLPYNREATLFADKFVAEGHALFGTALIVGPADGEGNDTNVRKSVLNYYNLEN